MRRYIPLVITLLLGGCASYQPQPLPKTPDLAAAPTNADGQVLKQMDLAQATALALRSNPDLKASRLKLGIAEANRRQIGLPPDPQLSLGLDHPTDAGAGLFNAYNLGLSEDLKWLITRGTRLKAARADELRQRLEIDWKAWQLAAQVQQLYLTLWYDQREQALLERQRQLYLRHHKAARRALAHGDITLDKAAATLVSLTQTEAQLAQLNRKAHQTRIQLNALLGMQANAHWQLQHPTLPTVPDTQQIDAALDQLSKRRPDLLALQAGYRSSDAHYRAAILGQFPSLNVGLTKARDTSNVHTIGLGITLNLPLFNGNRGQIAIARATRAQLHAAYQARLDQANTTVEALQARLADDRRSLARLQRQLPELNAVAKRARQAFASGNFTGASYIAIESNTLDRQREQLHLQQSLATGQLALRVLLGEMPSSQTNTHHHSS